MSNAFLSSQNIGLIWDLLSDEPTIRDLPQNKQENAYNTFIKNIQLFHKNEVENEPEDNLQLVSLNKKFLMIMTKMMRNELVTTNNLVEPPKKYTIEDIQSERQKMFENQLNQRKNEFERYNAPKKPPVPNFTENIENDKIKNIDELIAQAISQRNFDIPTFDIPKEPTPITKPINTNTNTSIKYIQIQEPISDTFNKEVIELTDINANTNASTSTNINAINFLEKLKVIKEPEPEPELNTNINKDILEILIGKIDELNTKIQQIYDKLNI